jgi:hypothetical protein
MFLQLQFALNHFTYSIFLLLESIMVFDIILKTHSSFAGLLIPSFQCSAWRDFFIPRLELFSEIKSLNYEFVAIHWEFVLMYLEVQIEMMVFVRDFN